MVKGYSTEMSVEVASLGVQVHGGMGFIEETGAAQYLRDARILPIYEGTTAIQANDLVGRKTARDGGRVAMGIAAQHRRHRSRTRNVDQRRGRSMARRLRAGRARLRAGGRLHRRQQQDRSERGVRRIGALPDAGRQPGVGLADGARAAGRRAHAGRRGRRLRLPATAKIATARFHAEHFLSKVPGMREAIVDGAASVMALPLDAF